MECDSGAGNPQQSSRAQGSRGSPAQLRPMESGGPVSKRDSGAFQSGGRWSSGLLPRRVSLCRMQLQEARFGSLVRRGLGAERTSWLRGHGWGLGAEGLPGPRPACPRRRTRGEWVSGARDPQQSSTAQGARRSPTPHRPMERAGPGAKTASTAFLSGGALGLWFAARGEFPIAECSSKKLVLVAGATGPRR